MDYSWKLLRLSDLLLIVADRSEKRTQLLDTCQNSGSCSELNYSNNKFKVFYLPKFEKMCDQFCSIVY